MAMVVDLNSKSGPVEVQFNVLNARSEVIDEKADMILRQLNDDLSGDRDTILSVLAKASEKLIEDSEIEESEKVAAS